MSARFLGLVKVSKQEATRMVNDGPAARRDFVSMLVHKAGGEVEGLWLTNVGDWDFVILVTMQDGSASLGAAATLARRASGLTESERWIELADVDDVTAALSGMANATPA